MKFTEYSVRNYPFTLVMIVMVVVVGVVTLLTMPRAEDPQILSPEFPVIAILPGTNPKDIEELVTKPIENRLYDLSDVDKIVSTIEDGVSITLIRFKDNVNSNEKLQEVNREINALRPELPPNLYSLEAKRVDPTGVNILQTALISENASYRTLKKEAERLSEGLEKVASLKEVTIYGCPEEIVKIDLRLDKMAQLKIPLSTVVGSIQSEAANIPGGNLTISDRVFNVKTSGKFVSLDDIASTVVFNNPNGKITYLRDIANVSFSYEEEKHITRLNGHRCILVNVAQKDGFNIAQTQKDYTAILDSFERKLPENIKFIKVFDQADNVARRLGGLAEDFMIAILLVLLTLLPLGLRASLIVMVAIPLSLALGLVGLNAFGFSLNQLSIVGFVVALGLLVDDSIVVVENIERWLREGHSKMDAAILGTKQIGLAVLGCTATLMIAFMPLMFLPGSSGQFIRSLPTAIICSIFGSLIVSLTVVPLLSSRFLKHHENPNGNIFLRLLKRAISGSYTKLLEHALKVPLLTLIISFILFGASLFLFKVIGFKIFPTSEKPIFMVNVKMPAQTSLAGSDSITRKIEDILKGTPEVKFYTSNVGKGNPRIYYNIIQRREKHDFAQIFVQLAPETMQKDKQAVIYALQKKFENFVDAKVEIKDFEQGPPIEAPVYIRVFGDNLDTLRSLSREVTEILTRSDKTIYVTNELDLLKTDVKVNINKEKARTLGILTADIDKTVRLAVAGLDIGKFSDDDGDDFLMRISVPKDRVATLQVFENLYVNNAIGTPIPLAQVANLTFETSPANINHLDKNRFAKVTSFVKKGVLSNDVLKEITPQLAQLRMPSGYSYKFAGEAETQKEAFAGGFMTVVILTIFLFIAILVLEFKTFKGTLIVLSVIPLGVIGGVLALWLTGNPLSFVAILGFIGLAGIEVKNSILLVDFTNQLRSEGKSLDDAIREAGEVRFLPIVLTSLTAIGGLLPIAVNPNPLVSPLALVLIGGLISSTLLSRIVTPIVYKLIPPRVEKLEDV
jgi:multidrug efflux pump subunit AcrB